MSSAVVNQDYSVDSRKKHQLRQGGGRQVCLPVKTRRTVTSDDGGPQEIFNGG